MVGVRNVQDFQFYVTDDRSSVRDLLFVSTRDAATARSMAKRMLADEHRRQVEVWCEGRKVFSVRRTRRLDARPAPAASMMV